MTLIGTVTPVLLVGAGAASDGTLQAALRSKGFVPVEAPDAEAAVKVLSSASCSAILTDFCALDHACFELLRRSFDGPILAICTECEEECIVRAVEWGADDVLIPPIRVGEFYGRIATLLKHSQRPKMERLEAGNLVLDFAKRRVLIDGEAIRLTPTEFEVLACLIRNRDCVTPQQAILHHVWGPHHGDYSQTLRVHVGHIRKKIEPDPAAPRYVLTEPGIGYIFQTNASSADSAGSSPANARSASAG